MRDSITVIPFLALLFGVGCATCPTPESHVATDGERAAIDEVLDGWHAAAAASDLEGYFGRMTPDAIFLGTDATERWTVAQFRAYAEQPFAEGRGWVMRSVRRDVIVRGDVAWFDEDLDARNLGAARGSGALVRGEDGVWRISHYDLTITVPNERFDEVRDLLAAPPSAAAE
jgi:ketosteroid isomerase-like protein